MMARTRNTNIPTAMRKGSRRTSTNTSVAPKDKITATHLEKKWKTKPDTGREFSTDKSHGQIAQGDSTLMESILKQSVGGFRRIKIALLVYALFDVFVGGFNGGFLPLTELAAGQAPGAPGNFNQQSFLHRVGGIFYSSGYNTWQGTLISGNTSTGSGTSVIIYPGPGGVETLADGTTLPLATIYNTSVPVILDLGQANQETVTPTAISIGACPAGNIGVGGSSQCVTLTGTINNTHGQSAIVVSGDNGIMEAVTDAGAQGGGVVFWMVDTGIVTLNTGGLTTTTTTKVPTNRSSVGCAARVTTTITTSANWAVGSTASGAAFCSANSTLTAGTTGVANQIAPTSLGTTSALEAIVFTMGTSNPGAGAIKARVWGYTPVQPAN